MKRAYIVGAVVVIAACGSSDGKKKAPEPSAGPSPAEVETAAAKAQAAVEATTAAALEAKRQAEEEARKRAEEEKAKALEEARRPGVLGHAALTQGGTFASITGTGDFSSGFDDVDIQGGLLGNEAGEMQGGFGFGRSGFGPGGGGTGLGTIGTGQYGTLGHGSGTTSGYGYGGGRGGMRGRSASVPQVRIGQPSCAGGDLDKAIVRRYIKRNIAKITYCYEKQLLARPSLEGTVNTQFTISPSGAVPAASASGVDAEVSSCVASVIKAIEFPKPADATALQCTYPFTFQRAGG